MPARDSVLQKELLVVTFRALVVTDGPHERDVILQVSREVLRAVLFAELDAELYAGEAFVVGPAPA